jgi:hypothetical protein
VLTVAQRIRYEQLIRGRFTGTMRAEADALLAALGNPPNVANIPPELWARLSGRLRAALEPVIVEMAVTSALQAGVGISVSFSATGVNTRAAQWASRYTFNLVRGIEATTRDMLRVEIERYFRDAKIDLKTLAGRIQPNIAPLQDRLGRILTSETRADLIASTEVTRAVAQGEQALIIEIEKANPKVKMIEIWLTANDELVCPICGPRHGKQRGTGWTEPPPAHPRCRCLASATIAELA